MHGIYKIDEGKDNLIQFLKFEGQKKVTVKVGS